MASLVKTNDEGLKVVPEVAPEGSAASEHVVHEALATPMEGVVNVDHSLLEPGVRTKMVERVKLLIAGGFYDRPGFIDLLAEKVRRELR